MSDEHYSADFSASFQALVEYCKKNNIRCNVDPDNRFIGFSMWGHSFHGRGEKTTDRLETVERYFPAIMRVMYGGHTSEDAIYPSPATKRPPPTRPKPRRPTVRRKTADLWDL